VFQMFGAMNIVFECPNKRVMVVHGKDGELVNSDEVEFEVEDEREEDFKPAERDLSVVQQVLNAQINVSEEQRENIFHSRCQIRDKVCGIIINNGSCTNVVSTTLVEKLGLTTVSNPKLIVYGGLTRMERFDKAGSCAFSIKTYHD